MESEDTTMDDFDDAGAALNSVRATQTALADRISSGGWLYDTAYSVLLAGLIGSVALAMPYKVIAIAISIALLLLLAKAWANHYGVWVSGTTPPRARWVAVTLGLVMVPLIGLNFFWYEEKTWPLWLPFAVSTTAFVAAFAGSRMWRSVYRRENGLQP